MALPLWNSKTTQTTLSCLHANGGALWGFVGVDSLKPSTACIQQWTAKLLGAGGRPEAPTSQRKPVFWLVNMGRDLVGQGAVFYDG